ncbi:hypothetical protein [Janibacter terrae]|uniref:hypothetical protein n=1 Tax=Janibacter terrae TaxID=103817 RepID=UPI00381FBD3E
MGTPRTVRGIGLVAALAVVTAGCVPGIGGEDPASSTPPPVGHGRLSEEQAASVLPGDDQMPSGFRRDTVEQETSGDDPQSTAYPATCLDVRLAGDVGKDLRTHRTTRVKRAWAGEVGGSLTVTVSSHDVAVPTQLFDDAGSAQGQCATFQLIDESGTSSWKLSPVTFPPLGERTYSMRVESTTEGDVFKGGVVQVAGVSVGHNLVHVVYAAGPGSRYDSRIVETVARTTVDNLEAL